MRIAVKDGLTTEIEELAEFWYEQYETSKSVQCGFKKFHLIAEENGQIIGILVGYTAFSEIYVDDLIVHEKFRKQGIGRKLLQGLECRAPVKLNQEEARKL